MENMTPNEKELLMKDLCARIPYHVRCKIWLKDGTTEEGLLDLEHNYGNVLQDAFYYNKIKDIKPYLFPMSSMTEEQEHEWDIIHFNPLDAILEGKYNNREEHLQLLSKSMSDPIQWCYENHFDCNGLIPLGLAIDATGLDVY